MRIHLFSEVTNPMRENYKLKYFSDGKYHMCGICILKPVSPRNMFFFAKGVQC